MELCPASMLCDLTIQVTVLNLMWRWWMYLHWCCVKLLTNGWSKIRMRRKRIATVASTNFTGSSAGDLTDEAKQLHKYYLLFTSLASKLMLLNCQQWSCFARVKDYWEYCCRVVQPNLTSFFFLERPHTLHVLFVASALACSLLLQLEMLFFIWPMLIRH